MRNHVQASTPPDFVPALAAAPVTKRAATRKPATVKHSDAEAQLAAVRRSRAALELTPDGKVLTANENFLRIFGYTNDEIAGADHGMFLEPRKRDPAREQAFWSALNRGEFFTGEFEQVDKHGNIVWMQSTFNPIFDAEGKVYKVAVFSSNITEKKRLSLDYERKLAAISRSQGVIEFSPDGIILDANQNMLSALGYTLDEVKGRHHRIFVDPDYAESAEYKKFWEQLTRGEFHFELYMRIHKSGRQIWIQASYNPVFDAEGKVYKIIKFAADATQQVKLRKQAAELEERSKQAAAEMQGKVSSLLQVVSAAAEGDLTRAVEVSGDDAAGQMAAGLQRLLSDFRNSIASIGQTAMGLAASSEQLSATSQQLMRSSQDAAAQAQGASSSSEQVSANVSVVAASSEEMLVSIREISKSAVEAARVAKSAVTLAESTNQTISKLGVSSQEIGKVIKVITSIAQQTNLLALNATIEAARAGEAGKGFAVVANEVKELAKETARATEEIGQKIEAIQADTKAAVKAIADVGEIINQVNDISNTIASAVEEQTATTNEIGRNVSDAARGTSEIAKSIGHVAYATEETSKGAQDTQTASRALTDMASQLQVLVQRFQI